MTLFTRFRFVENGPRDLSSQRRNHPILVRYNHRLILFDRSSEREEDFFHREPKCMILVHCQKPISNTFVIIRFLSIIEKFDFSFSISEFYVLNQFGKITH